MSATVFYLFLGFTAFSTLLQLLLSLRQSRAVLLHRGRVPRDFKDVVSLKNTKKPPTTRWPNSGFRVGIFCMKPCCC